VAASTPVRGNIDPRHIRDVVARLHGDFDSSARQLVAFDLGRRYPRVAASRLAQKGELIRLKQGLYLRSGLEHDTYALCSAANRPYGPSYISFVWALRFYGLIPEDVPHVTSATFAKGRSKRFDTPAGRAFLRRVGIIANDVIMYS